MSLRTIEENEMVRDRRVGRLVRGIMLRSAISLFILWHLSALFIWNMSGDSDLIKSLWGPVQPYMTATGFMQGWGMFAPDPYRLDIAVEARIHYANGAVVSWYFPRMAKLSYAVRYGKERWRKYVEVAEQDKQSFLWPSMALYAARVNERPGRGLPVSVDLVRHWRYIPPPGALPSPMTVVHMASYAIAPQDLQ